MYCKVPQSRSIPAPIRQGVRMQERRSMLVLPAAALLSPRRRLHIEPKVFFPHFARYRHLVLNDVIIFRIVYVNSLNETY